MLPISLQKIGYESIHQMIIKNELSKGDVTSEVHLSQILGMSRTPIRSALQRLELEGFLRIIPKQGILILDQSAQKTGDLIDTLASVLLFTITSLHHSKSGNLSIFIAEQEKFFDKLLLNQSEPSKALSNFELEFFLGLIDLIHNGEMNQLFSQTANRLYWQNNTKRWNAPHYKSSINCFQKLLQNILSAEMQVYETINPYIQLLKKTWT